MTRLPRPLLLLPALLLAAGAGYLGGRALLGSGSLVLESEPAAAVWLNGEYRGRTPLTVPDLPLGRYALRLTREGYQTHRQAVVVEGRTLLSPRLRPEPRAALRVTSRPSGAAVYLDGVRRGRTPAALADLEPGNHHLELVQTNYFPAARQVRLAAGEETTTHVVLDHRQERAYRAALQADPYDIAAYNDLGELLYVLERYDDAAEIYVEGFIAASAEHDFSTRAQQNIRRLAREPRQRHPHPDFIEALDERILAAMSRGERGRYLLQDFARIQWTRQPQRYREALDALLRHHPGETDLLLELAPHYTKLGAYDRLVELLRAAVEEQPEDAQLRLSVLEQLVEILERERDEAVRAVAEKQLAALESMKLNRRQSAETVWQRGRLAVLRQDKEKGLALGQKAIAAQPHEGIANRWRLELARQAKRQGKLDLAADLLYAALHSDHRNRHLHRQARQLWGTLAEEDRKAAARRAREAKKAEAAAKDEKE
jgi:tetratricopeptide (TPR) repeat protein